MTDDFRVENKNNTWLGGERTTFTLYEREGDRYISRGNFAAKGFDATDMRCVEAFFEVTSELKNGELK